MESFNRYQQNDRLERKRHGRVKVFMQRVFFVGVLTGIPLCIGLGFYALFYSNLFAIQTIDIQAPKSLNIESLRSLLYRQLDERIFHIFPQRTLFLFDEKDAKKKISSQILVRQLSFARVYPHTLRVTVDGKEFELVWYSDKGAWRVGADGVIIGASDQATIASLPIALIRKKYGADVLAIDQHTQPRVPAPTLIIDTKQQSVAQGTQVIERAALEPLLLLSEQCHKAGFDMAYIVYNKDDALISVVTKEGWEIYMTLKESLDHQLSNVSTLLSHSIKKERAHLKYIDVRFDNRLYYALF